MSGKPTTFEPFVPSPALLEWVSNLPDVTHRIETVNGVTKTQRWIIRRNACPERVAATERDPFARMRESLWGPCGIPCPKCGAKSGTTCKGEPASEEMAEEHEADTRAEWKASEDGTIIVPPENPRR